MSNAAGGEPWRAGAEPSGADTIEVYLNGQRTCVRPVTTVQTLVTQVRDDPRGVAVALNEEVLPRSRWGTTRLAQGDRIEMLVATQGG